MSVSITNMWRKFCLHELLLRGSSQRLTLSLTGSFSPMHLTACGLIRPTKEDNIWGKKTILMHQCGPIGSFPVGWELIQYNIPFPPPSACIGQCVHCTVLYYQYYLHYFKEENIFRVTKMLSLVSELIQICNLPISIGFLIKKSSQNSCKLMKNK